MFASTPKLTEMPLQMSRAGLAGPAGAITTGIAFGVPPLLHYASRQLQDKYLPDLLLGKKRTCIAITEPECVDKPQLPFFSCLLD